MEKSGEDLDMDFPLDVATVPFRIPNQVDQQELKYGKDENYVTFWFK